MKTRRGVESVVGRYVSCSLSFLVITIFELTHLFLLASLLTTCRYNTDCTRMVEDFGRSQKTLNLPRMLSYLLGGGYGLVVRPGMSK